MFRIKRDPLTKEAQFITYNNHPVLSLSDNSPANALFAEKVVGILNQELLARNKFQETFISFMANRQEITNFVNGVNNEI